MFLDNAEELTGTYDPRVIQLALSRGETAQSLIQQFAKDKLFAPVCQRLGQLQGDMNIGAGQTVPIGTMGLRQQKRLLPAIYNQLWDHILEQSGGHARRVVIIAVASGAGGTGSGVLRSVVDDITGFISKRSGAVINVYLFRFGPLGFTQCGNNIARNGAFTHAADLAWLLSPANGPKVIRQLIALNSPIKDGKNANARTEHISAICNAVCSPGAMGALGIAEANVALTGADGMGADVVAEDPGGFGRYRKYTLRIWNAPRRVNLPASAALFVLPSVRNIIQTAPVISTVQVKVGGSVSRMNNIRAQEVIQLAAAKQTLPPTWRTDYLAGKFQPQTSVTFQMPGANEDANLASLRALPLPRTLDEFQERRAWLASLLKAVQNQQAILDNANGRLSAALGKNAKQLQGNMSVAFGIGWGKLGNRKKALTRIAVGFKQYADLEEKLELGKAQAADLKALKDAIDAAIKQMTDLLTKAITLLDSVAKQDGAVAEIFTQVDINRVFTDLMIAVGSNNQSRFAEVLIGAIAGVSQRGVSLILNIAEDSSLGAIANALVVDGSIATPDVTDKDEHLPNETLVAMPPMDEHLVAGIQAAMSSIGKNWKVVPVNAVTEYLAVVVIRKTMASNLETAISSEMVAEIDGTPSQDWVRYTVPGDLGWEELQKMVTVMQNGTGSQSKKRGKK